MPTPTLDRSAIPALAGGLTRPVILPDDPAYEPTRALVYGGFDARPAIITRPVDAAEVAHVVRWARDAGLPLAVRSGGHGMLGTALVADGVVVDLRDLDALDIDVEGRTAWAGTGLTAGAYTRAAGEHGLATSFGDTPTVGLGGLAAGGGVGLLSRLHGLTIDHLLAAEVVTADGEVLVVDQATEPELFWAVRGGGGNVAITTRLHLRLHEVPRVTGGFLILPATPAVVAGFAAAAEAAPPEVSTMANVLAAAPPMPFIPESAHGRPAIVSLIVHAGVGDAATAALTPFRSLAEPLADLITAQPYASLFEDEAEGPPAPVLSMRTMFLDRVDEATAAHALERLAAAPGIGVLQLRVLGGAIDRVPADATAYAHRGRRVMAGVALMTQDPAARPAGDRWVEALAAELDQGVPGQYVNFVGSREGASARAAFPGATWDRMVAAKRRWDPDNVLRHNVNVPPSG